MEVRLLDENLRPADGGEIHLGGAYLGLGYLDRPGSPWRTTCRTRSRTRWSWPTRT
ncbi:hypothetical protein MF672_042095 [Actinomadura sp. ATCC 31491]|uniref:AMP-binding protein n=1 Tax=Actinomadura luzonensis TaxID=2805427 RepID=A0ABT0G7Y2_9ACTN|nr:hypothetical protein [Actinomadura luzonensis]MCK2220350.1 hypothetical protein [Actinomadura luzonensis]